MYPHLDSNEQRMSYADRLHIAEEQRLLQRIGSHTIRTMIWRSACDWLGRLLILWGWRLRARYGLLDR